MFFNINKNIIDSLRKERLNLDHLWYLEQMMNNSDIEDVLLAAPLERKNLLLGKRVTHEGKVYYNSLKNNNSPVVTVCLKTIKNEVEDPFEEFWNEFPRNADFDYKGKKFKGSRPLKTGTKAMMKLKFNKILQEQEFTAKQIIDALKYEIQEKKEASFKTGTNHMNFLKAMPAWLNGNVFQSYIGMTIQENKTNETYTGTVNI